MRLAQVLQMPDAQALLRYQKENPQDRQARLIFTDYLRDYDLTEVADCLCQSLEMSDAVALPDGSLVYDGWVTTPVFEIAKGVPMHFCWIPAGKARLGSPWREAKRSSAEKAHAYETQGFWLGKYPVTQAQWKLVMGKNPSRFKGAKLPVERVSWDDCQTFIKKCGVAFLQLRLPHEDEWEYACRGGLGNKQAFYWGDSLNGDKANCDGNFPYGTATKGAYMEKTTEVGSYESKAKHPWGLCDMSGNVWGWCDNLYSKESTSRVLRGGSWDCLPYGCRAADRIDFSPDVRRSNFGFRVCLALD